MKKLFFFIIFFTFISLINEQKTDEEILRENSVKCNTGASKDDSTCISISSSLTGSNYQCCAIDYWDDKNNKYHYCSAAQISAKDVDNYFNDKAVKAYLKESDGFSTYMNSKYDDISFEKNLKSLNQNYTGKCKDGDYSYHRGYYTYTSEEKNILKSKTHCFNYFYLSLENRNSSADSKETCFNAEILPSSKDAGLKCYNMLFRLQLSENNYTDISTCILSSEAIMAKRKQEDICFKTLATIMVLRFTNGMDNAKYKLYLNAPDGSVVDYNSLMDEDPTKFNQGYKFEKLLLSKFLFIFILILF
jgi:hypothetical protein